MLAHLSLGLLGSFVFSFFFFGNILYFSEHFQVHSKIERKVQRCLMYPQPLTGTASPIINSPTRWYFYYN